MLNPRPLTALAQAHPTRIQHIHSMAPAQIPLSELRIGRTFLERWPISRIHPEHDWRATHYTSNAPATFILHDVIVHSASGFIRIGNELVAETMSFSDPAENGYDIDAGGYLLRPSRTASLPGTHLTLLYGASNNYHHAIVDGVARLGMVPPHLAETAQSVLYPGTAAQTLLLAHATHPGALQRRIVACDEAFHVESLILPLSLHHEGAFHPCLSDFFDRVAAAVPQDGSDLPRRFYVDRRGSAARRLVNETEVIEHLLPLGFVPIRPETLSPVQQVRLFRNAEAIVAPHGAALTNLGWCRPGCAVLELQMDAYAHWFFRNLAGLRSLRYDCVFGRALDQWPADRGRTQGLRWVVSVGHVAAAVTESLLF